MRGLSFFVLLTGLVAIGVPPGANARAARHTLVGLASYVSSERDGEATASGAVYDERRMTAAHRTLAFGTRVRVTNLANGRRVIVIITDRGPFVRGRIIDVSKRAAIKLGFYERGVTRVRIKVLGPRPDRSRSTVATLL